MKKFFILLLSILLLTSCFQKSDDLEKAKKDLLWEDYKTETWINDNQKSSTWEAFLDLDITNQEQTSSWYYEISYLTWKNIIEIEEIKNVENIIDNLDINWIVNDKEIDKIVVKFSNKNSSFPEDIYTLKTYKKWDENFLYRAYKKYEVLDYWLNEYQIDAYKWNELVSSLKLEVFIDESKSSIQNNNNVTYESKNIWTEDNLVYLNLPVSDIYWEPVMLWQESFTYSKINNFEVKKDDSVINANCDNVTNYLKNRLSSWYYWNTCRPIFLNKWLYFYVLRLEGDNYYYEKHYLDKLHNLYGVLLLETWTWITKDNIAEKNNEFKQKSFDIIKNVDILFSEIIWN